MPQPLDWLNDALADLDRRGLRRTLVERSSPQASQIEIDNRRLINFGSNDYLGLAADPRLIAAVRSAIDQFGWGSGASPLVTGRTELHAQLEQALAKFEATEAALLFPTGYSANVGPITALVGEGDAIYSDEFNHASIIDGCRLSRAKVHIYRHASAAHLQELLHADVTFRRRLIVTDSLFSMHGDFAPLAELAELARRYNAMLMVDEAHATGVFGKHGRGCCERDMVEDAVHIRVGTLSKSLGSHGGFVAGSRKLIDWLANRARPYVFSTAAPPAIAAATLEALNILQKEPDRRHALHEIAGHLRQQLIDRGLVRPTSLSHIIPVYLHDPDRAVAAATELRRCGLYVPAIRPPSVPHGQSLLRISLTSLHTDQQINDLLAALLSTTK